MLIVVYKYNYYKVKTSYNTSLAADVNWKQRVVQISINIMPHALMSPKSGHNS